MVLRGLADAHGTVPVDAGLPGWPHGRPRVPADYCLDDAAQRAAFEALLQAGVLSVNGGPQGIGVALAPPSAPPPTLLTQPDARAYPIDHLGLFEGCGMGRLGIGELEGLLPPGTYLRSSWFAELHDGLSRAVQAYWECEFQKGLARPGEAGPVRHQKLASDVWDLFRAQDATGERPLDRWAESLPRDGLALISAGSPCVELTTAHPDKGKIGVCGRHSVLFHVIPAVIWYVRHRRPDVRVFAVVENAGSMRPEFVDYILAALGCDSYQQVVTLDAGHWSAFPRRRLWFSTLPAVALGNAPRPRPSPFDPGWAPRPDGTMPPLMGSRLPPPDPLPSYFQGHPQHCLYEVGHHLFWHEFAMHTVEHRIQRLLPPSLHGAFRKVCRGDTRDHEAEVRGYSEWLMREGPQHGVRFPNLAERARSTGRPEYLAGLHLSEYELFQVTGNYFDPDALRYRVLAPLTHAILTGCLAPAPLNPAALAVAYDRIMRGITGVRCPVCPSPFPADLHDWLVSGVPPPPLEPNVQAQLFGPHRSVATDEGSPGRTEPPHPLPAAGPVASPARPEQGPPPLAGRIPPTTSGSGRPGQAAPQPAGAATTAVPMGPTVAVPSSHTSDDEALLEAFAGPAAHGDVSGGGPAPPFGMTHADETLFAAYVSPPTDDDTAAGGATRPAGRGIPGTPARRASASSLARGPDGQAGRSRSSCSTLQEPGQAPPRSRSPSTGGHSIGATRAGAHAAAAQPHTPLTEAQRARIEQNRLQAQERKRQQHLRAPAGPGLASPSAGDTTPGTRFPAGAPHAAPPPPAFTAAPPGPGRVSAPDLAVDTGRPGQS